MARSHWHRIYVSEIAAPRELLFELISDMPNYNRWLPPSKAFTRTTAVEPYPVQLGSRYHDGNPDKPKPGKDWWGTVTGMQDPGSIDFHHTIKITQVHGTADVHIHYSFEPSESLKPGEAATHVERWLILEITMPVVFRPLRFAITSAFDKENVRTMAALKTYAEDFSKSA